MKGNTLSKNMTQTDSLTLTNAQVTSITCTMLDLPISAPTNILVGQCYFNPAYNYYLNLNLKKKNIKSRFLFLLSGSLF